jgi:hypothetical protein
VAFLKDFDNASTQDCLLAASSRIKNRLNQGLARILGHAFLPEFRLCPFPQFEEWLAQELLQINGIMGTAGEFACQLLQSIKGTHDTQRWQLTPLGLYGSVLLWLALAPLLGLALLRLAFALPLLPLPLTLLVVALLEGLLLEITSPVAFPGLTLPRLTIFRNRFTIQSVAEEAALVSGHHRQLKTIGEHPVPPARRAQGRGFPPWGPHPHSRLRACASLSWPPFSGRLSWPHACG